MDYIVFCDICEERKNLYRKKRSYIKSYLSGVKFERIGVDIVGLFFKLMNGFMYIIVILDYFIKFMEIFFLRNIDVEIVVEILFKGWIKCYGCF